MKGKQKIQSFLDHFPQEVAEYCFDLWNDNNFELYLSKSRNSKLGDFCIKKNEPLRITLNHDLPPYQFLITYIHEVAHYITYTKIKTLRNPHGKEWKKTFRELFEPILEESLLPEELIIELKKYLKNPAATSYGHEGLKKVLKKLEGNSSIITLEEIDNNSLFRIKNLILIKGELRRTRYLCKDANSNKKFLVSKFAEIIPLENFGNIIP